MTSHGVWCAISFRNIKSHSSTALCCAAPNCAWAVTTGCGGGTADDCPVINAWQMFPTCDGEFGRPLWCSIKYGLFHCLHMGAVCLRVHSEDISTNNRSKRRECQPTEQSTAPLSLIYGPYKIKHWGQHLSIALLTNLWKGQHAKKLIKTW